MSDNSPRPQSGSRNHADSRARLDFRPNEAGLIGNCLRRAFEDDDLEVKRGDRIDELLNLLK
ncbi:hypothetical protein [Parasphingopyxis lamellibrachiae]|uniref:hypothetical protein n=1 Tax=Parasphingopyxis lamellibrachiae TaxID=680125 RepID=UPI000E273D32|nr:hypothetical protein [Parasphingopyxis lamellibrachiae]